MGASRNAGVELTQPLLLDFVDDGTHSGGLYESFRVDRSSRETGDCDQCRSTNSVIDHGSSLMSIKRWVIGVAELREKLL